MTTVLITGASRGIGLEFARRYAENGFHVVATCRDPENATALHDIDGIDIERLDVDDLASAYAVRKSLEGRPVDILINNAGFFENKAKNGAVDYRAWLRLFNTNALGPLRTVQALLPNVLASDRKTLVFMTTAAASIASAKPTNYGYRMSKAALNLAARCLSMEFAEQGVTTLLICPGHVRTDLGGTTATVEVADSVGMMIDRIEESTRADNGRYFDRHGHDIPW